MPIEYLKTQGFKKFKTRNFIRVTSDYFLQIINFQKSAGFAYYINLNSIPLSTSINSFFAEGGIRIQSLNRNFKYHDSTGRFEFGTEYLMENNLLELDSFFKSKGIPWLNMLGNSSTYLEYEKATIDSTILKSVLNSRRGTEIELLFLKLQAQKFDLAKEYLTTLREMIASNNDRFYLARNKELINSIFIKIQNQEFHLLDSLIETNTQQSLKNLGLEKFKIYECPNTTLSNYLKIEHQNLPINPIPGDRGVEHFYLILDGNSQMLNNIKKRLERDYPIISISNQRFAVKFSEKASFHFALNNLKTVNDDIKDINKWAVKRGKDLTEIINQKTRIDVWCDSSYGNPFNSYQIRDHIFRIIYNEFSQLICKPGELLFFE